MEKITIITINTWKCDGDYNARLPLLTNQLSALNADIIACQECFVAAEIGADTLKYLSEALNMSYTFLPGRQKKREVQGQWVDSFSGLGILSAHPLKALNHFDLPKTPADDDRKVQQAVISLPSGKQLLMTNTHLTHISDAFNSRLKQAAALADIVLQNKSCEYHIVSGDFNATPGSAEIEAFVKKTAAVDCYSAGNGSEPRYSLADAFAVDRLICVDHLFAMPFPNGHKTSFINSAVVLNQQDQETGLYPSDHFGISTNLLIA